MLAQDTAFCFGVPSNTDTAELPIEGFKQLLSQVEAELYQSDVFRGAMARLEEAQNEAASVQFLLKSVGREAIRLALRQVVQQLDTVEAPLAEVKPQAPVQVQKPRIESSDDSDPDLLNLVPGWRKRANPSHRIDLEEQQRQVGLNHLGDRIRTAREAQLMSLEELRSKTLVPLHQLQSIESGHGAHLPEDIYLRGFIRRIAKALNLNAEQLLDTVPTPDPVKAILPSWYHPQTKSSSPISFGHLALRPAHLYVGYAALLAGGIAWLSHQPAPAPLPNAIDLNSPRVTTPNAKSQSNQSRSANVTLSVAPPETLR
ncbi:MAG: helix-turn-helix domain-containing protein [Myxacorys californica WJT36-NPBG1]|jgi:transcriptional regulator with XRE-family HTH domain|nr:helix-turn-helix domain-containing protein [Myxacorys californica WJT36-NPBG1]